MPPDLATTDLTAVEILAAGGPYHGKGSPPEGDFLTVRDLEDAAASFTALRGQLDAPVVLGHDEEQTLLRRSGMTGTDGEPAVGWLDNLRVQGTRLLADLKRVPETVAKLIEAGAYRKRSVVYHPTMTGPDGKEYRMVVSALGLLGAHPPAVASLADIVKLYAVADPDQDPHEVITGEPREYAAGPWKVTDSNPDCDGWAVVKPDGTLTGCHRDEAGARAQVKKLMRTMGPPGRNYSEEETVDELRKALGLADDADEGAIITAVQGLTAQATAQRDFAKDLGLDEAADMKAVVDAAVARAFAAKASEQDDEGDGDGDGEKVREEDAETVSLSREEYDALRKGALAGNESAEELRRMRRDAALDRAVAEHKIAPGARAEWSRDYDENPDLVTRQLSRMDPDPRLSTGEIGSDDRPGDGPTFTPEDERAYKDFMAGMGVTRLATVQD